jgi:hypothetical protein
MTDQTIEQLAQAIYKQLQSIAAVDEPRVLVVSGDEDAVRELRRACEAEGIAVQSAAPPEQPQPAAQPPQPAAQQPQPAAQPPQPAADGEESSGDDLYSSDEWVYCKSGEDRVGWRRHH